MEGQKKERWMELCAQAAVEQDPDKLQALVDEWPAFSKRTTISADAAKWHHEIRSIVN
jgi:hypothetical protein